MEIYVHTIDRLHGSVTLFSTIVGTRSDKLSVYWQI